MLSRIKQLDAMDLFLETKLSLFGKVIWTYEACFGHLTGDGFWDSWFCGHATFHYLSFVLEGAYKFGREKNDRKLQSILLSFKSRDGWG